MKVSKAALNNPNHESERVAKLLEWLMDHGQEDARVTVGCKTCKETQNLMAATAMTAWLRPFHWGHAVWSKNPFSRRNAK